MHTTTAHSAQREPFSTHRLNGADVEIFKDIRLEALQRVPQFFGSTYAVESKMKIEEWVAQLEDKTSAYFALRIGEEVVGITGIITNRDDTSQAILIASYIREEHRRKGGSEFLYRARIDWAREKGFSEIIVSHRASNISSKMANQKHGFVYSHSKPHTWNDGITEDNVFYTLPL